MARVSGLMGSLLLALGLCKSGMAADIAEKFPARPIRLVVPFGLGGYGEIVARLIGNALAQRLNTQVLVDVRPGASTIIGTEIVARAPADGYTLLLISTTHAVNPSLFKKLPYDPVLDFAAITLVASTPFALVVNPSLPARTLGEFMALARSRPGSLSYGSSGLGGSIHLTGELFKSATGLNIVHVPYKGSGPALTDLVGAHIQMTFTSTVTALPYVSSGQLRALAVTSLKRNQAAPNLPTIAESGYPGFEASSWLGILAPAKTAPSTVTLLQREIALALRAPAVAAALKSDGAEPGGDSPDAFAAFFRGEIAKWSKVVATAQIRME